MADAQPARTLLVRHASTDAVGAVLAGRNEGLPLNARGRAEAAALAEALQAIPIACVYTSPRDRALETAAAVARGHALSPIILPELDEVDFGMWTGRTLDQLSSEPGWRAFNASRETAGAPGGERLAEVRVRARRLLDRVRTWHAGEVVVAATHADIVRTALAEATGMGLDAASRFVISPASVTSLALWPDWAEVLRLNDSAPSSTSHGEAGYTEPRGRDAPTSTSGGPATCTRP